MNLETLKTTLSDTREVGDVYFDFKHYLNDTRNKTYPCVLWQLDGAEFERDLRSDAIQQTKTITITVFAIAVHDQNIDKIIEWDELETKFEAYLNEINGKSCLSIENIFELKGQYAGEGLISADQEIGIMYKGIRLKTWC